ncbi:tRNA preQ1(34) S-adenosylmethionine ribosyltransferase-isomerase QueA [Alphaproteobacteria bacterium]|nr:tRNA preQ1(34) S-adenosylmethionine ribosyltransferase-isomerase QueA [Alphaproteobacteria bacterium]
MKADLFDFELPESSIALRPSSPRDSAKLLCLAKSGELSDQSVFNLPDHLEKGDVVVVNNTKVIPARLSGVRHRQDSQANVDVTLLEPLTEAGHWSSFVRPAKRLKSGDVVEFSDYSARVISRDGASVVLDFSDVGNKFDAMLEQHGTMPLPPYIAAKRAPDIQDNDDYQTYFASISGAVAAPTAGLHFTPELLQTLQSKGVEIVEITLHVGAGTFLPVKVEDISTHKMHAEWGEITQDNADIMNQRTGRLMAVGTTSLRLLESAADDNGLIQPFAATTDIFISPGYRFKAVDLLMTNFHLPRSTLFMLVSAFSGLPVMQAAYQHAIETGYRFYSYGDACLLERA